MPFVHGEQLFMVHSVYPHRVFRMDPSGVAAAQYLTANHAGFAPYKDKHVHGGPPVILVPSHLAPGGQAYYLGIMHFFEVSGTG